nr:gag pol polyprotein [Hymenolepis microstoma]
MAKSFSQTGSCSRLSPDTYEPRGYREDGRVYAIRPFRVTILPEETKSIMDSSPFPNHCGGFIPNYAQSLQPLTDLLKGNRKHFTMTPEAESAFAAVRQQLSKATTSNHLDTSRGARIILKIDASQMIVGAYCNRLSTAKFSHYPSSRRRSRQEKQDAAHMVENCSELSHLQGSTHIRTMAYHPEANGIVELFHRELNSAIIATWSERPPTILLAIREPKSFLSRLKVSHTRCGRRVIFTSRLADYVK